VFAKKLRVLKEDIIQWNHSEFGNVSHQKKELLGALNLLDAKKRDLGLSEAEIHERNLVRSSFTGRDLMETKVENVMYQGG